MNGEAKKPSRVDAVFDDARTILDGLPSDEAAIARAKQAVLDDVRVRSVRERKSSRPWAWIAVSTTVVAAGAVLLFVGRSEPALTFAVDDAPGRTGAWLAASTSARTLRFDDASELVLAPESDATIASTTSRGARVVLTRGRVRAQITHRDDTEWKLEAGPFRIRVVGTSFETEWSPDAAYFELTVSEGAVEVEGPTLDARIVRAGSAVRVWVREERARTDEAPSVPRESESESESAPDHASLDEEHAPLAEEHAPLDETRGAGAAPSTRARRAEDVRSEPNDAITLARAGRFADAIAAVEAAGVDRVLRASTPTERLELADAARYARDASLAKRFYEAGPRTGDAGARAAFGLARVALDLDVSADAAGSSAAADRAEAIRWLRTSLRRSSRGALAREARGRLMELLHASGDPSAREVANEYLALHPDGPQAETARRIASP